MKTAMHEKIGKQMKGFYKRTHLFLFLIRFPEVAVIKRVSGSRRKIVHATLGFMAYGHIGFLVSRLEANQSVTRFP